MQNNTNIPKASLADRIPDVVFGYILKYLDPISQYRLCSISKAYREVFVSLLEDKNLLEKARNLSIVCRYINKRLNKCKSCRRRLLYEGILNAINSTKKSFLLLFDGIDLTIRLQCDAKDEIVRMVKILNKEFGKKLVYYHGSYIRYWPVLAYKIIINFYSANNATGLKRVPLNNIPDSVFTVT
jgi:hypothetical protein